MPDQNTQPQITFEQAVDSMHRTYPHMSHGDVLKQMQQWYDEGNPKVHSIPDVAGKLKIAALQGVTENLAAGLTETLGAPFHSLAQMGAAASAPGGAMHRGFSTAVTALDPAAISKEAEQVESSPVSRFVGQGAGLTALTEGTGLGPATRAVIKPGTNWLSKGARNAARGAVEMTGLQQMGSLGDMSPKSAAEVGAGLGVAAPLAGKALGAVGRKIFGRVAEAPPPPSPVEPIGSANIRSGRPFEVRTHVAMRSSRPNLYIYGDPRNPMFGEGPPISKTFQKPLILNVPNSGEEGWVHAAESLNADNPAILEGLREAKDPVGMAQELVARKAKQGGFDSVNLATPDVTNNVIMGVDKDWKPSPHPDIPQKLTQFQKKVPKSPFAKAQPELGDQIASAKEERVNNGEAREKVRKSLAKEAKEPNPLFHAKGDPDLEKQIKHKGKIAGLEGTYEPETQRMIKKVKERTGITQYTMSRRASDHPLHDEMIMHTEQEEASGEAEIDKLRKMYENFRKDAKDIYVEDETARQTNHDELMRAVDGLEYDLESGKWIQSALNVDPEYDARARQFNAIKNRIYERDTGMDAKVPYFLERYGLPHSRAQFERLRALQEPNGPRPQGLRPWSDNYQKVYEDLRKRPPLPEESFAASDTQGMLKFDFTHDLDIKPFTGYLRFQAHANEKAILESYIKQLKILGTSQHGLKFEDQDRLEQMIRRIDNIEARAQREDLRRQPNRDYIPRKKWSYASHIAKDPDAKPMVFETDPDKIVGNFIASHNNKRIADVALAYARKLIDDQSGTVYGSLKDRVIDWANGVRGATQFAADAKFTKQFNGMLRMFDPDAEGVTVHDIHKWTSQLLDLDRFLFLEVSPTRFPFINLTHSTLTTFAVHPLEAFEALGNVIVRPGKILGEAIEAGIIGHDSEWAKELGDIEAPFGGRILQPIRKVVRVFTWITENLRKAHAYETARIAASHGKFSRIIRGFVHDPEAFGGNVIQRQKAYQLAFTRDTQFNFSNIDKPLGFQGGPIKRAVTQFKTWPSGLGGFWSEAIRQKEYGVLARSLAAAALWGGGSVFVPFGGYEAIRHIVLRNTGLNLWSGTGMGYIFSKLGMHDSEMKIPSLTDPLGTLMLTNPGGLIGPMLGSALENISTISKDAISGKQYKLPQDLLRWLGGPQVQAAMQGWEEFKRGKVFDDGGVYAMNRPIMATIFRGLDMQKSVQSQHRDYETDISNAILSKDKKAVQDILDEAHRRGFVFDARSQRRIRAFVREHVRGQARSWQYVQ